MKSLGATVLPWQWHLAEGRNGIIINRTITRGFRTLGLETLIINGTITRGFRTRGLETLIINIAALQQ